MNSRCGGRRASLHTLGCRLNLAETAILREKLSAEGYDVVPFGEPADLGIINTCTVTNDADAKSRKAIRGFIRANPAAYVAVIGCYSQVACDAVSEIAGIDLIVGTQEKLNVLDYVRLGRNPRPLVVRDNIGRDDFTIDVPAGAPEGRRANLKVQDGCDFMCSFCVIPFARGRARSRDFGNLMQEAQELADRGVRELVITGVNIGTYSNDGQGLLDVIDALDAIDGLERIRISSIEPTTVPYGVFERMNNPQHALVPHLHLPVQSGSDHVLRLMRRRYARAEILDFVQRANSSVRSLCVGTDVLVGMPGESEQDFADTCSLLEEGPFAYAHVFKYSERAGTAAARLADRVADREKDRRAAHVRRLCAEHLTAFHARFEGEHMPVLFESRENGVWSGHTENYIRVAVKSDDILSNELRTVVIGRSHGGFVVGSLAGRKIEVSA